jgi:hypothetical protein
MHMQALELKIPPPALAVLIAGAMWGIALVAPLLDVCHTTVSIFAADPTHIF